MDKRTTSLSGIAQWFRDAAAIGENRGRFADETLIAMAETIELAALATQPATSQEGEETQDCGNLGWCHSPGDCSRHDIAATPTPPALSEDLLRKAVGLVYRIEAAGAVEYEGENFERWKADARALAPAIRAALAQVTAS